MTNLSKRNLLKTGLTVAAAAGIPSIVPSSVFGQYAPSKRINVGAIGPLFFKSDRSTFWGVCGDFLARLTGFKISNNYQQIQMVIGKVLRLTTHYFLMAFFLSN